MTFRRTCSWKQTLDDFPRKRFPHGAGRIGLALLACGAVLFLGCQPAAGPEPGAEPAATETPEAPHELHAIPAGSETEMEIYTRVIGQTPEGDDVEEYTLVNENGIRVTVMTYGATITGVHLPDRDGEFANVTLYLDSLDDYFAGHPYFGSLVGRYANRIAKGRFELDGTEYTLATNDGPNHLHGGEQGFDKRLWQAEPVEEEGAVGVMLTYISPARLPLPCFTS